MKSNKTLLIECINLTKYPDHVKQYAIDQVEIKNEISDLDFQNAIKNLPAFMERTKKYLTFYNRIKKFGLSLSRHSYAPELNELYIRIGKNLKVIKTPQITEIDQAIYYMFCKGIQYK